MSDDRYAPPTAPLTDPSALRAPGRIDLGEALSEAWSTTWSHFGTLFVAGLVLWAVALLATLTVVGIFLVVPVLFWGGVRLLLNTIDGEGEVGDVFAGFSSYGSVLAGMIVLVLLLSLLGFVGQLVQTFGRTAGSGFLVFVGVLVNIAWVLAVMSRLVFATYYLVDRDLAPVAALRTSWEQTADQKLTCVLLAILNVVILLIGVACLVVGVIPAVMIVGLLHAACFRQLAGR
jgi:uncharacterized membrane protein